MRKICENGMKIMSVLDQFRESKEKIFKDWLRQMRDAGYDNPRMTGRKDFRRRFDGLLSALALCLQKTEQDNSGKRDDAGVCLVQPMVDDVRFGQERGMDLKLFLCYFKTMISCLEKKMVQAAIPPLEQTNTIIKLRRVADFTEMAIVARWQTLEPVASSQEILNPATLDKLLGTIFMSVGEGILLVDEDFEIVRVNQHACEIFGMQMQNMIGTNVRSLMEEDHASLLIRHLANMIEGQRRNIEVICLYVDGKTFPATVTTARSDMGKKRYWSLIVRDDTAQKTMETQLRHEKRQIEDMNLALKIVMKSIEQDRKDFENRVASKIKTSLLPGLKKIDTAEASVRKSYLAILEQQLVALTAGSEKELNAGLLKLTKTEIEVCRMIQAGCSSKDICNAMKISYNTIQTHRKNIRKKLGLAGKRLNLHAFLMNHVL